MFLKAVIFGICTAALAGAASAAERAPLYVDKAGFDCLVRNIRSIGKTRGDPLMIDLSTCPPKIRPRLRSLPSYRRSLPTFHRKAQTVLVLTRAQIECIRTYRNRLDRLRQLVDGNRYRVSLAVCAR